LKMRIAVGNDHRGVEVKRTVTQILSETGNDVQDYGANDTSPVDYPDIARKVGEAVTSGKADRGVLICDTGIGMSIAANKIKGIRAALCYDAFCAYRSRLHNDANVLVISAHHTEPEMREIIAKFLDTDFEGGRHIVRVDKIKAMES